MKLAEILDALKERHGGASNAEIGRILGIDKRRIGDYYGTERTPTDEDYAKIAMASGIREDEIRAAVKLERAKDETERKLWGEYLKKFGGVAASLAMPFCAFVILEMTPGIAEAAPAQSYDTGMICIMSIIAGFWKWQTKLRGVGFPSCFGVLVGQVRQVAA